MSLDYPEIIAAAKTLVLNSDWAEDQQGRQKLILSIEVDGVSVEGLFLRATSRRSMPDRKVMVQLEHAVPHQPTEPLCRIEWRPLRPHRNNLQGPKEFRLIDIPGSHHHSFALNWYAPEERMLRENLPIAVPILPEPEGFNQLLALISKEFRISNAEAIAIPPWDLLL